MENTTTNFQQEQKPVQYAGFWWRFLAYLIDNIIISTVMWILLIPVFAIFGISMYSLQQSGANLDNDPAFIGSIVLGYSMVGILSLVGTWLYYALMESSKHQGTLGKMALKIKVTDYEGNRVNFGQATGRYFGKIISGIILMIGYIMAGFTEKNKPCTTSWQAVM